MKDLLKIVRFYLIFIFILIFSSCANNSNIKKDSINIENKKYSDRKLYKEIFENISVNLDNADEKYIDLKSNFENSPLVINSALALAIAHMQKKEYLLANFYLQEVLQIDSNNELAKYLLSKNQFLYTKSLANDQSYMEKSIKALEINRNLLTDDEYKLLADSMLLRIKLDKIYNNQNIGKMYKKLNKNKAYELYINKTLNLNINPKNIYKP